MTGNFVYSNPTKLYFGDNAISFLGSELGNYGPRVMLCYGGGSIKKNGIYDDVVRILHEAGKEIIEDPGVMSNPTLDKLLEGSALARENNVDLILAVGGGSVIDYAKGVSVSAWCEEDPWEKYYIRMEEVDNRIIPVGSILTMVGTGSEMNGGSVITNTGQKLKIGMVFGDNVMPRFAILNPKYTFSVPRYQMVAGIFDIFSHICEQYFSGSDDNTSDYISEGLMRSVIHASYAAVKDPQDYEARSNLMWSASWALNTLIGKGKTQDWEVHMMGQAVGAYTDATHGMTLAAVSIPYYRFIMESGLPKFARFARTVWDVDTKGMTERQAAEAGLDAMEAWMKDIGVVMKLSELGVTEDMIEGITDSTFLLDGGYRTLTREETIGIFRKAL